MVVIYAWSRYFIKKPLSSNKNTFIKKPLSSKNHFHQKNETKGWDSQYSPCLCEGVAFTQTWCARLSRFNKPPCGASNAGDVPHETLFEVERRVFGSLGFSGSGVQVFWGVPLGRREVSFFFGEGGVPFFWRGGVPLGEGEEGVSFFWGGGGVPFFFGRGRRSLWEVGGEEREEVSLWGRGGGVPFFLGEEGGPFWEGGRGGVPLGEGRGGGVPFGERRGWGVPMRGERGWVSLWGRRECPFFFGGGRGGVPLGRRGGTGREWVSF